MEPEVVLELLLAVLEVVVVVKPVNFLNNLILLQTEHRDMLVDALVLVVILALVVLVDLLMGVIVLMLLAGLLPDASPIL